MVADNQNLRILTGFSARFGTNVKIVSLFCKLSVSVFYVFSLPVSLSFHTPVPSLSALCGCISFFISA